MIVPTGTLIMVIDGAKLCLFRNVGEALAPKLTLVESADHPSRQSAELGSDRPGRRFESIGSGRGAYDGPDYHQQDKDHFAELAAARLNGLADTERHLILVADPHVLGVMRPQIGEAAQRLLLASVSKDYAGRPPRAIAEMLVRYGD